MFYGSFPKHLIDYLERLQQQACKTILPEHDYEDSLNVLNIPQLTDRRQNPTTNIQTTNYIAYCHLQTPWKSSLEKDENLNFPIRERLDLEMILLMLTPENINV